MSADRVGRRPWFVLVTGGPGSGKTLLGVALAGALHLPFLSRDQIRGGQVATAGLWAGRIEEAPAREAAVDAFVEVVEAMAELRVSAVLELVVTPDRLDALRRIEEAGNVAVVLAVAVDAPARADRRDRADLLLDRDAVLEALGYDSIDDYVAGSERSVVAAQAQLPFDLPLLRVATDDGYDPPLDEVVDWVLALAAG